MKIDVVVIANDDLYFCTIYIALKVYSKKTHSNSIKTNMERHLILIFSV